VTDWRAAVAVGALSAAVVAANVAVKPQLQARATVRATDSVVRGREWRGRLAPALTIAATDGATTQTSGTASRLRVLVFFGTWSANAADALRAMDDFAVRARAGRRPIDVVLVDAQEAAEVATTFARTFAPNLSLALDENGAAMQAFEVRTLPTLVAIDHEGRVALYYEGPLFNVDVALEPLLPRATALPESR
jgi:hypothetical protein